MPNSAFDGDELSIGKLPGAFLSRLLGDLALDDPTVVVGPGIGRDAAAVRIGDAILVLKTDPITFATAGAARYLVNINGNDLACLGATPKWLLVTGMFPLGTTRDEIAATFAELNEATSDARISLVGGHTEITDAVNRPILVGMLAGIAAPSRLLAPGGAKTGDLLILSRPVAIEGTALLAEELGDQLDELIDPVMVSRARGLIDSPGLSVATDAAIAFEVVDVHAMHDPTEGGIATGAREIAEASGLAAEVTLDRIPMLPETRAIADALRIDPLGMLASGSLLVAVAKPEARALLNAWERSGAQPAVIGRLVDAGEGHRLIDGFETRELPAFITDEVSRALKSMRG